MSRCAYANVEGRHTLGVCWWRWYVEGSTRRWQGGGVARGRRAWRGVAACGRGGAARAGRTGRAGGVGRRGAGRLAGGRSTEWAGGRAARQS